MNIKIVKMTKKQLKFELKEQFKNTTKKQNEKK